MKKGLLIVFAFTFIVTLCFVSFTNAEVQIKDYDSVKNTQIFKAYISGVGMGIFWANAQLQSTGQPLLYCPPEKLVLTTENYLRILQETINKYENIIKSDTCVEMLLLKGLTETFPCKK